MESRIILAACACAILFPAQALTVIVENPLPEARSGELVEVDASAALKKYPAGFRILDCDGREVPCQLLSGGKMVMEVSAGPEETRVYQVEEGMATPVDTVAYGRLFPERLDDFAWENDRAAFRAYGPALQRSGQRAYGYDVWTKSVPYPVLEKRFHGEIVDHVSYHDDHGEGMDVYNVGPTLGGGAPALLGSGGEIVYPWCFEECEVLENGPLRFSFRLIYPETVADGRRVRERRTVTLDKGAWLNHSIVEYEGVAPCTKAVAGIVVHEARPEDYVLDAREGIILYNDPTDNVDNGNGDIFTAVWMPGADRVSYEFLPEKRGDAVAHVLARCSLSPNGGMEYWWGSGWSKGGVEDMSHWHRILLDSKRRVLHPMRAEIR